VDSRLDDLDGGVVADVDGDVGRQWHLRQAKRARVRAVRRADDLEDGHHGERHVERHGADAQVDVDEGGLVAGEPTGLEGHGAAL